MSNNQDAATKRREPRIAVIGAGPAGLAVAHYLKWLGYREVMVFEKLARVGGLCKSITDGYRAFDLGGTYLTPSYRETLALARAVGAERYRGKKYQPIRIEEDGTVQQLRTQDWVREEVGWPRFLAGMCKFWWERMKVRRYVDSPIYEDIHEREDLCMSFQEWLESKDLAFLERLFHIPVTMMGYGFLHEVAAPYVLKYMSTGMFWAMALRGLPAIEWFFGWPHRFEEGFERMWQRVAWGLNVRTDVEVQRIVRNDREDLPVEIRLSFKDRIHPHDLGRSTTTLHFDRLIVACPLSPDVLYPLLGNHRGEDQTTLPDVPAELQSAAHPRGITRDRIDDLSDEERSLFAQVKTFTYVQATLHAVVREGEGDDQVEVPYKLPAPVVPVFPFEERTLGKPWVVVQVWGADSRLLQFYSRVDPPADETPAQRDALKTRVEEAAVELLQRLGAEVAGSVHDHLARWRTYDRWPYFGYVEPEAIRAGFFRDLEALQGKRNTYYTGGATTFEMVEAILRHAKHIAGRVDEDLRSHHFRQPRRTAPQPWAHVISEGI